MQGSPQLVSNPSLRPEPVGPEGDRALRVLLRTDDLNLCGPLFDDIPGENGARLLYRAIPTWFAQGLAPLWHSELSGMSLIILKWKHIFEHRLPSCTIFFDYHFSENCHEWFIYRFDATVKGAYANENVVNAVAELTEWCH